MCVITGRCWGSGCGSGVLIVGVMVAGVALGICFGAVLNLHFLRKQHFLSVIFPDLSSLIRYQQFGRTVMTFSVLLHWWFSGFCMITVTLVCNRKRLWVCLLYLSTIWVFRWWWSSSRHCAAATHSRCGLWRVDCEEMESQSRWSRSCAGDRHTPWIGVFWSCWYCYMDTLIGR